MSRGNVEIVRRIFEAWARGDFRAGIGDLDPHVMLITRPDFPEFGVFVGLDGVSDFMRSFLEGWERLSIETKHLQAVGDTVMAHVVQHGKGRASGIEADQTYFMLFTFRGKKIVRIENVIDEGEALEAVGLKDNAPRTTRRVSRPSKP
jgi:ketosteroid isomerase-like protein